MGVRVQRLGYRMASVLINVDRRLRSSHGRGVKMILSDPQGRQLLVRHTYGRRHWTFPGGGVHTSEDPLDAALRECFEELGVRPHQLQSLGTYPARSKRRIDVVSVFTAVVDPSHVSPNGVELNSIGWFPASDLPTDRDPNVAVALGLLDGHQAELVAARNHAT